MLETDILNLDQVVALWLFENVNKKGISNSPEISRIVNDCKLAP